MTRYASAPTIETTSGGSGCKRATHETTSAAKRSGGTHDESAYAAPWVKKSAAKNAHGSRASNPTTTRGVRFAIGRRSTQRAAPKKNNIMRAQSGAIVRPRGDEIVTA